MIIVFTSSADPYFRSVIEYFKIEQIPHRIISLEKCYISFVDIIEDNFCLTTDDGFDIVYNEIDFFLYRSGHLKNRKDEKVNLWRPVFYLSGIWSCRLQKKGRW